MTQRSLCNWIGFVGLPALALAACGGSIDLQKPRSDSAAAAAGNSNESAGTGSIPSAGGTADVSQKPVSAGSDSGGATNAGGEAGEQPPSQAGADSGGTAGAPPVEGPTQIAWLAFDAQPDETRGVYLVSASAQCFDRITPEGVTAKQPSFSPDGKLLAYAAQKDGVYQIFTRQIEGDTEEQITSLPQGASYPSFNPSGAGLAFVTGDPEALRDGSIADSSSMGDLMELDFKTKTPRLIAARGSAYPYFAPAFSGSDRIFVSDSHGILGFYLSDGSWSGPRLSSPPSVCQEPAPSPDGQWLAYPDTCGTMLQLYKHRIDLGSPRSCASHSFDHESGVVAPDWGAFGMIAVELLGPDRGLRLFDENDLSPRGGIATPKKARNPSWSPASFKRACR